jgi:two-component system LytT family response regulator
MRIESIIIDHEPTVSLYLRNCLVSKFPEIAIRGEASNYVEACELIRATNPGLVFSDVDIFNKVSTARTAESSRNDYEIIYISDRSEDAISAIRQNACGFLLKPLSLSDIIVSVGNAIQKLTERSVYREVAPHDSGFLPHTRLIGIPTMEGIDFLHVHEIVRCEGLQKCTRIITAHGNNIVSSYNIGEFRKILHEFGFFSCHKSHLINLMFVKKLTKEGFVILADNSAVPLARRKRIEFLQNVKHP